MNAKKRVGIYGGTFNPPHIGHINAVICFQKELSLDKVIIVPAGIPPHKSVEDNVDPALRFEMAKQTFAPLGDYAEVSDYEIFSETPNYSVDTVSHFQSPDAELYLLCGTDMFMSFESWREFRKIFEMATVVCMPRENESRRKLLRKSKQYAALYNARCVILSGKCIELSSSLIRSKIKNGEDVSELLPAPVLEIIKREALYE